METNAMRVIDMREADLERIVRKVFVEMASEYNNLSEQNEGFIDITAAAKLLKISKVSIYRRVRSKSIPFFREGRKLVFKASQLIKWVEESSK